MGYNGPIAYYGTNLPEQGDTRLSETGLLWQTDIFAILPHATEPWILMLSGEKRFFLPRFRLDGRGLWVKVGLLKQEMQKTFGLEVNVLRQAYY